LKTYPDRLPIFKTENRRNVGQEVKKPIHSDSSKSWGRELEWYGLVAGIPSPKPKLNVSLFSVKPNCERNEVLRRGCHRFWTHGAPCVIVELEPKVRNAMDVLERLPLWCENKTSVLVGSCGLILHAFGL
jgi:hypothetical protein